MLNTIQKGEIALLKVQLRAAALGYIVSKPCFEGVRYDLILDRCGVLTRVQVKYTDAEIRADAYHVELKRHTGGYNRRLYTYSRDEIDAVVVYLARLDAFAWLPLEVWEGRGSVVLRTEPTRNGQRRNVNFLDDYRW